MSRNISREKRENLLSKIREIRTFLEGANASPAMKAYLSELESELKRQKFGLVFEEHKEEIDEILETHIPVLTEDKSLYIENGGQMNFLIEGDNLAALTLLEKTHKGDIDVIFIDPPYNRGKRDFMYDDNYIDTVDTFKHSKWLSFLKKRLTIARRLLKNNGVILINIDDNEFAQLKLLCDDIFGYQNYIACFPWHNRDSIQNDTDMSINHEYILAYAKNRRQTNRRLKTSNAETWFSLDDFVFQPMETDESKYSNPDNDPRGKWKADPFDAPAIRVNLTYTIINPYTKVEYLPPKGRHWRTEQSKFEALLADNRIVFGKNGKSKPQLKVFFQEVKGKGEIANSWFDSDIYDTSTNGKKELLSILPHLAAEEMFDTPKPKKLYMELLKCILSPKVKQPVVLDFFAGSGTVGHAVMAYNTENSTNISYILCTNDESDICTKTTYPRLKTVITGKREDGSIFDEPVSASLKYQKVGFIPISEKAYYDYANELLLHIRELVELENAINFEGNTNLAILLTEDEVEKFFADSKTINRVKTIYLGHDIALTLTQQQQIADNNIGLNIIPEYYYKEQQA